MLIEQAIFTSARTDRGDGYQLVATSPGIAEEDEQALRVWSPSHGSLLPGAPRSINFYRLPSGAFCVARTTPAGAEFSGRGGDEILTHSLLVPGDVLARFANDPFALLRAAEAGGRLATEHHGERRVAAFPLVGRASPVNALLLDGCYAQWGHSQWGLVVQSVLAAPAIGLAGVAPGPESERLIAGVLACLPVECRTEISFSTGLRHSDRRPFRLMVCHADDDAARRLQRQPGFRKLELAAEGATSRESLAGWGEFVAGQLTSGGAERLASQLAAPRPGLNLGDLPRLARELTGSPRRDGPRAALATSSVAQAHAAHRRFVKSRDPGDVQSLNRSDVPAARLAGPAKRLGGRAATAESPRVIERLEALDDAVYDTIAGKPGPLPQLVSLWPQVLAELGPELIEESREHYLAFALRIWNEFADTENPPQHALHALDVLEVLLGRREK